MRLQYLTANSAYVFTFGDQLVRMRDHEMFFSSRADAVAAAREAGLNVSRAGDVSSDTNTPDGAIADRVNA